VGGPQSFPRLNLRIRAGPSLPRSRHTTGQQSEESAIGFIDAGSPGYVVSMELTVPKGAYGDRHLPIFRLGRAIHNALNLRVYNLQEEDQEMVRDRAVYTYEQCRDEQGRRLRRGDLDLDHSVPHATWPMELVVGGGDRRHSVPP
jgi:hypothetical protein